MPWLMLCPWAIKIKDFDFCFLVGGILSFMADILWEVILVVIFERIYGCFGLGFVRVAGGNLFMA